MTLSQCRTAASSRSMQVSTPHRPFHLKGSEQLPLEATDRTLYSRHLLALLSKILVEIRYASLEVINACGDFLPTMPRTLCDNAIATKFDEIRQGHWRLQTIVVGRRNVFHQPSVTATTQETGAKWEKCFRQYSKLSRLAETARSWGEEIQKARLRICRLSITRVLEIRVERIH